MNRLKLLVIGIIILVSSPVFTQSTDHQPELKRIGYTSHFDQTYREYYVYLPKGYNQNSKVKWPVILFLHGNGERGNGTTELPFTMAHGPIYEAWVQKRDLPFIIIQPQLHIHGFNKDPNSYFNKRKLEDYPKRLAQGTPPRTQQGQIDYEMNGSLSNDNYPYTAYGPPMGWETVEQDLLDMLTTVQEKYHVDQKKVYLTGLSYGGFGTWYMASKHPKLFAAINPIVGWGHVDLMPSIASHQIPVWCFAGGRDNTIKVEYFYPGLNQLERLGHQNLRFTIEGDMGHLTWLRTYAGDDLYHWFLQHQLK